MMAVLHTPRGDITAVLNFQAIPELQKFLVPDVCPTDRKLGRGAYGTVEEVEIPGATCAAKIIHEDLLRMGNEDEVRSITEKFVRECRLMSSLRHPHVVQFLGVCFLPSSQLPALVMEKLVISLHKLLETTPNIPLATKHFMLCDVARGLVYLHSHAPPIIHQNLTAKNVLLNSGMVAKLADLGVARIVDIHPSQLAGSGLIVYMPPEALEPGANFDTKLDIFSFGCLALFTLTQVFPILKAANYIDPVARQRIARSELERRADHIQHVCEALGQQHALVKIVEQCLQDFPNDRPTIKEVMQQLEGDPIADCHEEMTKLQLWQKLETLQLENTKLQERLKQLQDVVQPCSLSQTCGDTINDQQQNPLQLLNIKWRRGTQCATRIDGDLQMDILDGKMYMKSFKSIAVYDPGEDRWYTHSSTPDGQYNFALAVVNCQLVLTGGIVTRDPFSDSSYATIINKVTVWNSSVRNWEDPYPPMPTARHSTQMICYLHYLIAVGGLNQEKHSAVTNVEILDTSRSQWHIAESLPKPCYLKQSAIVVDTLYLLGSSSSDSSPSLIFRASLPTLVSMATSKREAATPTWQTLPDIPFVCTGLLAYETSLLAIGHYKSEVTVISGIHVYSTDTTGWKHVGDLPTAFQVRMCVVLPSKEILVVTNQNEVYIGTPSSMQLEN